MKKKLVCLSWKKLPETQQMIHGILKGERWIPKVPDLLNVNCLKSFRTANIIDDVVALGRKIMTCRRQTASLNS